MTTVLDNPPSQIVARLLIDLGLATDPDAQPLEAWPAYFDNEPSDPDNCVTVYDTQGIDSGRSMPDGVVLRHWGFQVRIRSTDKPSGWQKAEAIRDAFERTVYSNLVNVPEDVGTGNESYRVYCVAKIGQTLSIGTDSPSTKRHLHTVNAVLAVRQLS